jgi:hypothetical protein
MSARAADQRCAADPHFFSPASAGPFLRATSRRHVAAEQLVVRCAGPADASADGCLKSAMAALVAFMSCGSRAAAAYARCSPSRGAGLARLPIASGRLRPSGSKVNPGSPLGQPWVPDFWVDIRGSPHKNRQPWVSQFPLLRALGNQTKLSTFDTVSFRVRRRPDHFHTLRCAPPLHSPCQKFENTDYFLKIPAKSTMRGSMKLWEAAQ